MASHAGFSVSGTCLALYALASLDAAAALTLGHDVAVAGLVGRAGSSFAGFPLFSNGSLSGLNLTSACESALYQKISCADETTALVTFENVDSFDNATETARICDAGCEASLAHLHGQVAASCVGASASLVDGMSFVSLVDLVWSNWNESCLVDKATGANCNDLVDTYLNVTDVADIPESELCSYCMTETLAMMQADAYSSMYDENWQTIYEDVAAKCNLTVANFNATSSAFNVSSPVTPANCVSGVTYTTVAGDTCDSIALAKGVSAATLFYANADIHNCSAVAAGTELCLPLTCTTLYQVQANDTCSSIAADNGLLSRQVVGYNSLLTPNCSNLHGTNPFWGTVLCVSTPGGTYNGTAPAGSSGSGDDASPVSAPSGSTIAPNTTTDCGAWYVAGTTGNYTCAQICLNYVVAINEFTAANPSLNKTTCDADLVRGDAYCVQPLSGWQYSNATAPTPTSSATTSATSSATVSAITSTATPDGAEPGTAAGCDVWYYVVSGDTCYSITQEFGITLDQFYAWNSKVGSDCGGLWLHAYVCVGVE